MKRTRWAFAAAFLGIVIGGLIFCFAGPKEPSYNGRSLSFWLEEWGKSYNNRTNPATIAIRAIGSNGVPILLARLSEDESPGKLGFWQFVGKVVPEELNPINQDITRAVTAAEAINLLGVEAKSAFPTLTNLFTIRSHRLTAAIGLAGMGHEGIAVLLEALTNQDWAIRHNAAHALGEAGSDYDKVVPALIKMVKIEGNTQIDSLLRGAAGSSLVQLHKEPELVVPVFSEFLASPDANMRCFGASLLGGLGPDAKAAVPLLLKAHSDEDASVREMAEIAFKDIDPQAAGKAGLK